MPRLTSFAERQALTLVNTAFINALRDRSAIRSANEGAGDFPSIAGAGGVQLLGALISMERPGAGSLSRILDARRDWRDRLVLYATTYKATSLGGDARFPGSPLDHEFTSVAHDWHLGYTGTGVSVGAALNAYHMVVGSLRLYASTNHNGALLVDLPSSAGEVLVNAIIRIWATEQLGVNSSPTAVPAILASDGAAINPRDLNLVQDGGMLHQAASGTVGGSSYVSDSMPFGKVVKGSPPVPELWTVRGTERRQRAMGAVRRFFALQISNNTNVKIDDSVDWRDRVICAQGRYLGSDIRPGQADDDNNNSANKYEETEYIGPGITIPSAAVVGSSYLLDLNAGQTLIMFVDVATGALYIRNDVGSTQYVTGMIDASFQLGPRTPR